MSDSKEIEITIAAINAMTNVLSAVSNTYFQDKSQKDEIVERASKIISQRLRTLEA